jgi:hypothetical protein
VEQFNTAWVEKMSEDATHRRVCDFILTAEGKRVTKKEWRKKEGD